jgi:ketosteroid isomerase-like protein
MTDVDLSNAKLIGGSAADRDAILAQFRDYLVANTNYDGAALQAIWSDAPEATFFNLNGHVYRGRAHWLRLWDYYRSRVSNSVWEPYDIAGTVSDDLAVVWCLRRTFYKWVGDGPLDAGRRPERSSISRSTMVFRKEDGTWRVVHVHFSTASEDPRPGGV